MRSTTLQLTLIATALALPVRADHIEELVVTARHDQRTVDVTDELSISPDVAQLLTRAPGMDVNRNGPLTGIPQYRGMYGNRIATTIDGTQLAGAGPNAMDPPLSYAAAGQLDSLVLYRGIAPVSAAQESIGGVVEAVSHRGDFAEPGKTLLNGRVIASAQSASEGTHLNASAIASTAQHRFQVGALTERGEDMRFPGGEILPSEYRRQRYDMGYGFRSGRHTVQLDYAYNDTGDAGTAALPMDIETIEGDLLGAHYTFDGGETLRIDATVYASELDHTMTNFHLRTPPPPSRRRRNTADASNLGFSWKALLGDDVEGWRVGIDGFTEAHNSDIDNPENAMFFVTNFNEAERDILGLFLERLQPVSDKSSIEAGLRYNRVVMDAGVVDATPARMMPPAQALRDAFNAADRSRTDDNFDIAVRARFAATARSSWYLGVARKTRTPSYQERYLWLPLEATGGLADGRLYTGNIDLEPEVSRQLELGLDYSDDVFTVAPRIFYSDVKDYIQGTPSEVAPAVMFVQMMNNMNGTGNADPLQFNNVDAVLYGFDMDWRLRLSGHWSLSGLINYVRGERNDGSDDNLYRIAPPNATLRIHYRAANWNAELEGTAYADQDEVSLTNSEQDSDGYGVVNLALNWQTTSALQLSAGIDNLLDEQYEPHLGGYNRAQNPDVALRARLPAAGINAFVRALYAF